MDSGSGIISNLAPRSPFSAPVGSFMLHLMREDAQADRTIGKLYIDGVWMWWTLEDQIRPAGVKVEGATAIPPGCYRVIMSRSVRFGRVMPELLNVPGFAGVRLHIGNGPADTHGCVLIGGGYDRRSRMLLHSKAAVESVEQAINQVINNNNGRQVWIEIVNPPEMRA